MYLFGKRFTKTSSINYIRSITNLKLNIKQTANIAPFKGGKSSKTLLLSEQIQRLNMRFLTIRRQLACFNCSQSDTILFNDNNDTTTPPQPGFICKSCSKTFSSNAMVDFIKTTTNSPFEEDTNAMEVSSPFVTNPDTNIGTAVISFGNTQLLAFIGRLQKNYSKRKLSYNKKGMKLSSYIPTSLKNLMKHLQPMITIAITFYF